MLQQVILEEIEQHAELQSKLYLFQGLPKADKMELIIQKAVELGARGIVPFESERCIKRPDEKRSEARLERLNRIAEEAAKQCGRGRIPIVMPYMTYAQAVRACGENAFICYENERSFSLKSYLRTLSEKKADSLSFFVGPEGGYSEQEIALAAEQGIPAVELGPRILRCETASGFVLSSLTYEFEL